MGVEREALKVFQIGKTLLQDLLPNGMEWLYSESPWIFSC